MQGLYAGGTSYESQSLKDIYEDVVNWRKIVIDTIEVIESMLEKSEESGMFYKTESRFQKIVLDSVETFKKYDKQLLEIQNCIATRQISNEIVNKLDSIGRESIELNNEYGLAYHKNEIEWHEYGNPDFSVIEKIYEEGRDTCATLMDAANAADRLGDFI